MNSKVLCDNRGEKQSSLEEVKGQELLAKELSTSSELCGMECDASISWEMEQVRPRFSRCMLQKMFLLCLEGGEPTSI